MDEKKTITKNLLQGGLIQSKIKNKKIYLGTSLNKAKFSPSHSDKTQNNENNINTKKSNNFEKANNDNNCGNINNNTNSEKVNRDKILHENNLKVIFELEKKLAELEKEDSLLNEDYKRLEEEENKIKEETENIDEEIDSKKDELENLKNINDEKNREYLHLTHLRIQQSMANSNSNSQRDLNSGNINRTNSNTITNESEQQNDELGQFSLGDVLNTLLRLPRPEQSGSIINPSDSEIENEQDVDLGPPMTFAQIENLPFSKYPRNDSQDKCIICGFDLCFNDLITKLQKCNHIFHKECLGNFLLQKQASKCPICKISIID